jgi:hypothetical protein
MKRLLLIPAVVLVVAGCGGGGKSATTTKASPSLTGSAAFLADVRHAGLGDTNVWNSSDDGLIKVGNDMCQGLSSGQSYGAAVETLTGSGKNITTAQADILVRSAVHNLCPDQASTLP